LFTWRYESTRQKKEICNLFLGAHIVNGKCDLRILGKFDRQRSLRGKKCPDVDIKE